MDTNKIRGGRQLWLDELRGIAMILVIFGHFCPEWSEYFVFTSPIKIPLFFAITGYCFNFRDGDALSWIRNILRKLVLPWLILSLVWFKVFVALIKGDVTACMNYVVAFISGKTLWYMPCCIVAEVLHFAVLKVSKNRTKFEVLYSAVLAVAGFGLSSFGIGDFMLINTAMIVQIYIEIGTLLKQWVQKAIGANNVSKESVILMAVYIILGCVSMMCYPGKAMDVHTNTYHNIALLLCMVIIGVSALFLSFSRLSVRNRILSFIGQNTLVFYMLNPYAVKTINIISRKAGVIVPKNLFGFLVETAYVCLICATFSILINKGCPWILGKKYNYK